MAKRRYTKAELKKELNKLWKEAKKGSEKARHDYFKLKYGSEEFREAYFRVEKIEKRPRTKKKEEISNHEFREICLRVVELLKNKKAKRLVDAIEIAAKEESVDPNIVLSRYMDRDEFEKLPETLQEVVKIARKLANLSERPE